MRRWGRWAWRLATRTVAILALGIGLLLAALRLALPGLEHYRTEVADWLSASLGQRVSIGALNAHWDGWTPSLWVRDVRLIDDASSDRRNRALARFETATLTIDPVASLRTGELRLATVTVSGASLVISHGADGALSVRGLDDEAAGAGEGPNAIARLLLGQAQLELRSIRLLWLDERLGKRPVSVSDVNLIVHNHDDRHHIRFSGRLDGRVDGTVSLIADLRGDLLTPGWSGQVFLNAADLDLSLATRPVEALGLHGAEGVADLDIWSAWRFGELQQAEGRLELRDATFPMAASRVSLSAASGSFVATRADDGWTVGLERVRVRDRADWPLTGATLHYIASRQGRPARLIGKVDVLDIERVVPYLEADRSGIWPVVRRAAPKGVISELHFSLEPARAWSTVSLKAYFTDLSTTQSGWLPALGGVDGVLELGPGRGALWAHRGSFEVALPEVLERRLGMDTLAGRLAWTRDSSGWRLQMNDFRVGNAHLEARVTGAWRWTHGSTSPQLSVVMRLERADLAHLSSYLPAGVIPAGLSRWVRRAVLGGRIEDGELLFHGSPEQLPFDHAEGRLTAHARFSGVDLRYARGWPGIDNLAGVASFDGRRADFEVIGGTVLGSRIRRGHITVADMTAERPVLEMQGEFTGRSEQGAAFLRQSPLGARFSHFLNSVSARGPSHLELKVEMPLRGGNKRVAGALRVVDNGVDLPGLAQGLQKVSGTFEFEGGAVNADQVEALYLGRPIALTARPRAGGNGTRIEIAGQASRDYLAAHLYNAGLLDSADAERSPWLSRLRGAANWHAVVEVPNVRNEDDPVAVLRVTSDLSGAAFDLPVPLDKAAMERVELDVRARFAAGGARSVVVRYGDLVAGAFELEADAGQHRLTRGAIRFGASAAVLPEVSGVTVSGALARLPVADWYDLLGSVAIAGAPAGRAEPSGGLLASVRSVQLDIATLHAFGSDIEGVNIDASRDRDEGWIARLRGDQLRGEIRVPREIDSAAVVAEFNRLMLPERAQDAARPEIDFDPRRLPPFRFVCRSCSLGGRDLGRIDIVAQPHPQGSRFESVRLSGAGFELSGNGTWTYLDGAHRSHVNAEITSDDLGALLSAFGYHARGATGGSAQIRLNAAWPASPLDFDLRRIDGVLDFRAREGRLTEVKSGAGGRLFGLLMLTSLPRRLALDFSDLFEEGFTYDRMNGRFTIEGGDAYTNDFVVESPTARIELAGRTGLVDEDYDQVVTVTPRVSSSLPLAPIWLAEKLLNKQLFDKVFAFRYTISGSWKDPLVEPIVVESPDQERG